MTFSQKLDEIVLDLLQFVETIPDYENKLDKITVDCYINLARPDDDLEEWYVGAMLTYVCGAEEEIKFLLNHYTPEGIKGLLHDN